MPILDDIWIMAASGITMYKRVENETVDEQLFGGFMSAVNAFATQIDTSGISGFQIGNKRFIRVEKSGVHFIANFDRSIKDKKAIEELHAIANRFITTYAAILPSWNGNADAFKDFRTIPGNDPGNVTGNFQQAFW